ncbi:uncharacterized protein ASCRUDRAFT_113130 [Ascoidea rubescens DSM 1968]|uniref:Uncharacterized protein n=1 Tax=Ascoidea rubescens DSM 1968 TaxID=1344418 RepID=A0A1D2VC34_9ASCO|nr:hypothetical protein ASCRUDRAFT_113130 [Ascoidea rubescens DSM 1968]ODV59122.1 hypothetical protein ASCRUDRAFT_113130 [Ascoidea rubescens DSM 1968]
MVNPMLYQTHPNTVSQILLRYIFCASKPSHIYYEHLGAPGPWYAKRIGKSLWKMFCNSMLCFTLSSALNTKIFTKEVLVTSISYNQ